MKLKNWFIASALGVAIATPATVISIVNNINISNNRKNIDSSIKKIEDDISGDEKTEAEFKENAIIKVMDSYRTDLINWMTSQDFDVKFISKDYMVEKDDKTGEVPIIDLFNYQSGIFPEKTIILNFVKNSKNNFIIFDYESFSIKGDNPKKVESDFFGKTYSNYWSNLSDPTSAPDSMDIHDGLLFNNWLNMYNATKSKIQ